MIIDSKDFKAFFEVAYDVMNISELKCFKCGNRLEEHENLSGLTCSNKHEIGYLEYMTNYANMLKDIADNAEINGMTFKKKVIEPSNIIYTENEIIFCDENIVRI